MAASIFYSADHRFDRRRSYDLTGRRQATLEYDVIVPRGQKIDGRGVRLDLVYAQAIPRAATPPAASRRGTHAAGFRHQAEKRGDDRPVGRQAPAARWISRPCRPASRVQVALEAVATTPFRVSFESQNAGVLLLQGASGRARRRPCPWLAPRRARGRRGAARLPRHGRDRHGRRPAEDDAGGDVLDARAKRRPSKDVLTITIEPSLSGPSG